MVAMVSTFKGSDLKYSEKRRIPPLVALGRALGPPDGRGNSRDFPYCAEFSTAPVALIDPRRYQAETSPRVALIDNITISERRTYILDRKNLTASMRLPSGSRIKAA